MSSQPNLPALVAASAASTVAWQTDLKELFDEAKDRFPDVVWELVVEETGHTDEVWGHKAIVYARAPPTFQARYFSFRPAPIASPTPYSSSPVPYPPTQSAVSLGVDASPNRSPSPYGMRGTSPVPSTLPGPLLRLTTTISSVLFSNELEYLYTGKGMGAAFEFLFDSPEKREVGDIEENRIDKLRQDLVYMWRARLYSDIRIALTGNFSSSAPPDAEATTAVFSSHRFILASRSPYFRSQLLSSFTPPTAGPNGPVTITLPSPPFTPASLHFTLGFIYTGTLMFSHRTFDLDTAFAIVRSATYLDLSSLYNEIEARIVEDMAHGLFHAYLPFDEYEKLHNGKWGASGCRCRQCQRRAPRILQFAMSDDVKNKILERGSRRALVGMFGEGWVTSEFAALPVKMRLSLLKGLVNRTTPQNIIPLLFATHYALNKLNGNNEPWAETVREMVLEARKKIDEVLCNQSEASFETAEWVELLEADGGRFNDLEKIGWVMDAVRRGLNDVNPGTVYQTLVSSILLRPHPTDPTTTLLSSTSSVRALIEQTRLDVIQWLRKHWVSVKLAAGFDQLEGYAIKEISQELEVTVEELLSVEPGPAKGPPTKTGLRPTLPSSRADDTRTNGDGKSGHLAPLSSAASSIRSEVSSLAPITSPRSPTSPINGQVGTPTGPKNRLLGTNFRSGTSSTVDTATSNRSAASTSSSSKAAQSVPARKSVSANTMEGTSRPKSIAPSVTSVVSNASTVRRAGLTNPPNGSTATGVLKTSPSQTKATLSPNSASTSARRRQSTTTGPTISRPSSRVSTNSEVSPLLKPPSGKPEPSASRTRKTSTTSTISNASVSKQVSAPQPLRARRSSNASTASAVSVSVSPTTRGRRMSQAATPTPSKKRPQSTASVRSNVSTTSTLAERRRAVSNKEKEKPPELPRKVAKSAPSPSPVVPATSTSSAAKGKRKADDVPPPVAPKPPARTAPTPPPKSPPKPIPPQVATEAPTRASNGSTLERPTSSLLSPDSAKSDGNSTLRGIPKRLTMDRRGSTDTITGSTTTASTLRPNAATRPSAPQRPLPATPSEPATADSRRGITLNVGIPCIISSKRRRFRAFARYVGEVVGERGQWVGVEVPVGGSGGIDKLEGRDWNDGTWGGIRYFEIGAGPEWEDGAERAARRRRIEYATNFASRKREGEQLSVERPKRLRSNSPAVSDVSSSELRGLFVRPKQVLYVVDAIAQA